MEQHQQNAMSDLKEYFSGHIYLPGHRYVRLQRNQSRYSVVTTHCGNPLADSFQRAAGWDNRRTTGLTLKEALAVAKEAEAWWRHNEGDSDAPVTVAARAKREQKPKTVEGLL